MASAISRIVPVERGHLSVPADHDDPDQWNRNGQREERPGGRRDDRPGPAHGVNAWLLGRQSLVSTGNVAVSSSFPAGRTARRPPLGLPGKVKCAELVAAGLTGYGIGIESLARLGLPGCRVTIRGRHDHALDFAQR